MHGTVDFKPAKCDGCLVCQGPDHPDFKRPSCNMSGIVYALHCTLCNAGYVGETSRSASTRLGEHLGSIPTARQWLSANPGKDVTKAKVPLSMWAVHACAEHPDTNIAEHTAIGLVRKTRGYGHRMCMEGNYYEVFRPSENKRAGGSYGINRLR